VNHASYFISPVITDTNKIKIRIQQMTSNYRETVGWSKESRTLSYADSVWPTTDQDYIKTNSSQDGELTPCKTSTLTDLEEQTFGI